MGRYCVERIRKGPLGRKTLLSKGLEVGGETVYIGTKDRVSLYRKVRTSVS